MWHENQHHTHSHIMFNVTYMSILVSLRSPQTNWKIGKLCVSLFDELCLNICFYCVKIIFLMLKIPPNRSHT